jgi:hypothetical protein
MEAPRQLWHTLAMAKHPKRPRDPAQIAKLIVDIAIGEVKENPCKRERCRQA